MKIKTHSNITKFLIIFSETVFSNVVYIGDSGPGVSLEGGSVVSVILGQQL